MKNLILVILVSVFTQASWADHGHKHLRIQKIMKRVLEIGKSYSYNNRDYKGFEIRSKQYRDEPHEVRIFVFTGVNLGKEMGGFSPAKAYMAFEDWVANKHGHLDVIQYYYFFDLKGHITAAGKDKIVRDEEGRGKTLSLLKGIKHPELQKRLKRELDWWQTELQPQ